MNSFQPLKRSKKSHKPVEPSAGEIEALRAKYNLTKKKVRSNTVDHT